MLKIHAFTNFPATESNFTFSHFPAERPVRSLHLKFLILTIMFTTKLVIDGPLFLILTVSATDHEHILGDHLKFFILTIMFSTKQVTDSSYQIVLDTDRQFHRS